MSNITLMEYSQEIAPKIRSLIEKKETLKEWADGDETVQDFKDEIKTAQDEMKEYIENAEATLTREIQDLELDIKLATKAAAKGTEYKAADLKAFFFARAKESVEKVVDKGELFAELSSELS